VLLMTSHCTGPSVYDLQGMMSSIVERYRAGRSVSQVSVTAADDQHSQRLLTCRVNPVIVL